MPTSRRGASAALLKFLREEGNRGVVPRAKTQRQSVLLSDHAVGGVHGARGQPEPQERDRRRGRGQAGEARQAQARGLGGTTGLGVGVERAP